MRVFGERELVRKQGRVIFYDLRLKYRPFVTHTKVFKGYEATFFSFFLPVPQIGSDASRLP